MTDDVTTGQTPQADAIRALVEERERYESWLTALDGRRAATPAHVFDRVRADYDGRLRGVRDRLAEHVGPLRDAEAELVRQHEEVGRRLAERQDELAELELRTLVGEFDREDGERRVQTAAGGVRELEGERRDASDRLTELRSLIARAQGSAPAAAEAPAAEVPAAEADEAAEAAAPPTVSLAPTMEPEPATPAAEAPETVAAPETLELVDPTPAAAQPTTEEWSGALDEDGFVGTGQRLDALAASLGGAVAPPPPAAASAGQEKTLRCQECGEMNYPTEWYCERCGGELAAL